MDIVPLLLICAPTAPCTTPGQGSTPSRPGLGGWRSPAGLEEEVVGKSERNCREEAAGQGRGPDGFLLRKPVGNSCAAVPWPAAPITVTQLAARRRLQATSPPAPPQARPASHEFLQPPAPRQLHGLKQSGGRRPPVQRSPGWLRPVSSSPRAHEAEKGT